MRNKRTRGAVERVTLAFTRLLVYSSTYSLVYPSTGLLGYLFTSLLDFKKPVTPSTLPA